MMDIGCDDAEFRTHFKFLITCYHQQDLTLAVSLKIFWVSKISIFVNFDLDLHFHGHPLHALDGQAQCDQFGENLMKIG